MQLVFPAIQYADVNQYCLDLIYKCILAHSRIVFFQFRMGQKQCWNLLGKSIYIIQWQSMALLCVLPSVQNTSKPSYPFLLQYCKVYQQLYSTCEYKCMWNVKMVVKFQLQGDYFILHVQLCTWLVSAFLVIPNIYQ